MLCYKRTYCTVKIRGKRAVENEVISRNLCNEVVKSRGIFCQIYNNTALAVYCCFGDFKRIAGFCSNCRPELFCGSSLRIIRSNYNVIICVNRFFAYAYLNGRCVTAVSIGYVCFAGLGISPKCVKKLSKIRASVTVNGVYVVCKRIAVVGIYVSSRAEVDSYRASYVKSREGNFI